MARLFVVLISSLLCGCALFGEALSISQRQASEVPEGARINGAGFTITAPDPGCYLKKDFPTEGGITLRPIETLGQGMAYFVAPFAPDQAQTTEEALEEWNLTPKRKGLPVKILESRKTSFQNRPATEAVVVVDSGNRTKTAAFLVVKGSLGYLVLSYSPPKFIEFDRQKSTAASKDGLRRLIQNTTITLD
ncbi:MAG: hypothetical protein AAGD22_16130 [Verrucomicrobiota bacterium]